MEDQTIARDTLNNDRNEEEGEDDEEERRHQIWFALRKEDGVADEETSDIESIDLNIDDAMSLTSLTGYMRKKKNQFLRYVCDVEEGKLVRLRIVADHGLSLYYLAQCGYAVIKLEYNDFCQSSFHRIGFSSTHSHQSSAFPNLKSLEIRLTHQSFEWLSSWMADKVFPCLTSLEAQNKFTSLEEQNKFRSTMTFEPYLMWMTDKNLPSFRRLWFTGEYFSYKRDPDKHSEVEMDNILVLLGRLDSHLAEKLNRINFDKCFVTGKHLETLLIDILPRFPNLCLLAASKFCETPNFPEVLDRIIRRKAATVFNTKAKQLMLQIRPAITGNPGWEPRLALFLKYFKNVSSLGFTNHEIHLKMDSYELRELKYALIKNGVGRRLIEYYDCSNDDGEANGSNRKRDTDRDTGPCLPISVWPILLERAQRKVEPFLLDDGYIATGVYYLLREGPVLREYHNLNERGRKKLKRAAADKTSSDMRKNDE